MVWTNKIFRILLVALVLPLLVSCAFPVYKFNGSSINYDKIKTLMITDFPIRSDYVYAPLATKFNEDLKDVFVRQTRLKMVKRTPDLSIEGEITGYNQFNEAVNSSGYASKTKLTLTVNVRFVNNVDHKQDFERQFTAFRTYDSTQLLTQVQDQLIAEMSKEICDQIFNATVANW
jgi:outer membrane lipopolysaccharide assembly protein LptE/RlpB